MDLKIGYRTFKIKFKNKLKYINEEGDKKTAKGLFDSQKGLISLDPRWHKEEVKQVLWHEILHGFESFLDLDLTEDLVNNLATCLHLFIKDNPAFVKAMIVGNTAQEALQAKKVKKGKRKHA